MPQIRYINIGGKPKNPVIQALALIVGLIVFGFAVFVGGIVLAGLFGFFLLAGLGLYLRMLWLRSRFGDRRQAPRSTSRGAKSPGSRESKSADFVEAEYRVIESDAPDDEGRL